MLRWRPALGLGLCLLAGTSLWALWAYVRNWPPVSYVPYYLPCPEIFNLKLQHKGEEPLQPVAQPLYPQPKLLEQRRLEEQMIPAHGVSPGSSRRAPCWCQLRSSLSCCEVAGATPLSTWGTRDPEAGTGLPPVTQHKRRVRTWPRLPPREALSTGTSPATRPTELLTLTPWLAPIISEGTFNPELLQLIYQPLNLTIGVTVFAVGKYTLFVQHFLDSAEEFFMRGYRVHYYIFTHDPAAIPRVPLGAGRLLSIIPVRRHSHWEEISTRRMETISLHIAKRAHREVDYLFCLDVDMVFRNLWGPETLGELVAAIHPGYFTASRQQFPYERRRASTAFVADSEGDFYYGGAVFGGRVASVYEFTRVCHMAILTDKANGIMAIWQEESHLNRHFISHKPSKVLSPEYLWDDRKPQPPSLKLIRFSTVNKDTSWLRS